MFTSLCSSILIIKQPQYRIPLGEVYRHLGKALYLFGKVCMQPSLTCASIRRRSHWYRSLVLAFDGLHCCWDDLKSIFHISQILYYRKHYRSRSWGRYIKHLVQIRSLFFYEHSHVYSTHNKHVDFAFQWCLFVTWLSPSRPSSNMYPPINFILSIHQIIYQPNPP
jgi:hypothetical protein